MKTKFIITFLFFLNYHVFLSAQFKVSTISLNGEWQYGENRNYLKTTSVPGITTNAKEINNDKLWFKKKIVFPNGNWKYATLQLNGARFNPEVYINSEKVSEQNGGMAPTNHLLVHPAIKPGANINLEIALSTLNQINSQNASYIPKADQWRSNVSSCLWDDINLKLHGNYYISRIIPFTNIDSGFVELKWEINPVIASDTILPKSIVGKIKDEFGNVILSNQQQINKKEGKLKIKFNSQIKFWSPEEPKIYKIELLILDKNGIVDSEEINYGAKKFISNQYKFYLNNIPYTIRAGTVVWHRWTRDLEGQELAWDTTWFVQNVIKPLKERGANTLRFHLGVPPERFLNLCDKHGLLVQYEWSFFHGMPAKYESLIEQWKNWLDLAMKHPCIGVIHPYNETEGDELKIAWNAINTLIKDYPPLVIEDRDVIHIHKYWWSMFENVGIYYDDAKQFPKTVMVDEFGGNYLDGNYNLGGYKSLKESYMRFLGFHHTAEMRNYHHQISNARIAEYWRRIGVAGFSPFCIIGSWDDGNHWYEGELKNGKLKPVWNALTAAYSPISVSIDIWDRHFTPSQIVKLPVCFFNDTEEKQLLKAIIKIESNNQIIKQWPIEMELDSFSKKIKNTYINIPTEIGKYKLSCELINKPVNIIPPVISSWDFEVFVAKKDLSLSNITLGIPTYETELISFFKRYTIPVVEINEKCNIIVLSLKSWEKIQTNDKIFIDQLSKEIDKGKNIIFLDAGLRNLGQGYPSNPNELGPLQGVVQLTNSKADTIDFIKDIKLYFKETAEPESHIHPSKQDSSLWYQLNYDAGWLWNGYRGGLIVPASDMELTGLSQSAFIEKWKSKGADEKIITSGASYFAYELQDFYLFSDKENDQQTISELRKKIKFLAEDAPALANVLNVYAPVKMINLKEQYNQSKNGKALRFIAMVNCGKNLTRVPVVKIEFGKDKGTIILSQLLTAGRLEQKTNEEFNTYNVRYDEICQQFVLNMIKSVQTTK